MTSSADDWMMYQEDQRGYLSSYVIQSMFDRPVLVFRKGRRPIDSRIPRTLKAEIEPRLTRDRSRVTGTVAVRNIGDTTWLGGGDHVGHVQLGFRLLQADGRPLNMEFNRFQLALDIAPGGATEIAVESMLPDSGTPYVLKVDLVDEGISWFEDVGSRPVYVAL